MFESLEETMRHDRAAASTKSERMMLWSTIALVCLAVLGGLYFGVKYLN
jgi:hypothetical protein